MSSPLIFSILLELSCRPVDSTAVSTIRSVELAHQEGNLGSRDTLHRDHPDEIRYTRIADVSGYDVRYAIEGLVESDRHFRRTAVHHDIADTLRTGHYSLHLGTQITHLQRLRLSSTIDIE